MTQYNKPIDLPAWAESGDKVQPSNAEIQTGWPLSTVPPSRQRFNWLLNWLSQGMRYFMQRSVAEWDATEDYPLYGFTQFNGLTYRAINGTGNINQQPDTATTFWERWGYSFSQIQPRVDLFVSVAVTTADVTLTAAQYEAGILNITGALTGNRTVIMPNITRRMIVTNNTTGAFTLSLKTVAGVAVSIVQGSSNVILLDGANALLTVLDASTIVKGKIQLATSAEAQALTDALKAITPATLAAALQGSNQSLAASGYQKLPGGLIIQWGTGSSGASGTTNNFPIAFPNTVFSLALAGFNTGAVLYTHNSLNVNGFFLQNWNTAGTQQAGQSARYIAIGN